MDAALRLHVSPSYVHNQTQTIKAELGARTIPACVMRAHAMGLLSHPTGSDLVVLALAA